MNTLQQVENLGQSIWLDFIRRDLLVNGGLRRLVKDDGVSGVTSNPAIFHKAIVETGDYHDQLQAIARSGERDAAAVYEHLALEDVTGAADVLRPVYEESEGRDGFVSIEVSPYLANDTEATCTAARRLFAAVDRPNVMIKVPATAAGLPAIERLIGEGINVNTTLLFSVDVYEQVALAYMKGLERLIAAGGDPSRTAGVASFFVSRIDSAVDRLLTEASAAVQNEDQRNALARLRGRTAVANAKRAYQRYQALLSGDRWEALLAQGARPQRLLWASTSVKNPDYRDVLYVEELIGPNTVNTLPPATLEAFRDHGRAASTLATGLDEAETVLAQLDEAGIPLTAVTDQLLADGVRLFQEAHDKVLQGVEAALAGQP